MILDRDILGKVISYLELAGAPIVELSAGFFRDYTCPAGCGGCCKAVSLEYLKDSDRWREFEEIYPEHVSMFEEVEFKGQIVMKYDNEDHGDRFCHFLDKENGRCGIHMNAPFPCKFALSKFIDRTNTTGKSYLNTTAYGRGWAFLQIDRKTRGAMCEVIDFNYDKFLKDLEKLKELREFGVKLNMPSKLKYIIEYLEENKEAFKDPQNLPKANLMFKEDNVL